MLKRAAECAQPDRDDRNVAEALASSAPPKTRMRSCGRRGPDDRSWAKAIAGQRAGHGRSARLLGRQGDRQLGDPLDDESDRA